jgi:hypothetical protein
MLADGETDGRHHVRYHISASEVGSEALLAERTRRHGLTSRAHCSWVDYFRLDLHWIVLSAQGTHRLR